jgi:hypothetical protein
MINQAHRLHRHLLGFANHPHRCPLHRQRDCIALNIEKLVNVPID